MPLQIRRGTDAERLILTQPPVDGELIWTTDDRKLYIGDGVTLASNLVPVTGYNDSDSVDAVINAINAGTHENITWDFTGNAISATVTLTDYTGTLKADGFQGSLFADDSGTLVDAVEGSINLDGTVKGHIIPTGDEDYDIGSSLHKFRDLYLSGSSITLGTAQITSTGNAINLPAGSTIGGAAISTPVGDFTGSVFADDSTLLVDGVNATIRGDIDTSSIKVAAIGDSSEAPLTIEELGAGSGLVGLTTPVGTYLQALTDRFYVGTVNREGQLRAYSLTDNHITSNLISYTDNATASAQLALTRSRGDSVNPAALQNGDVIYKQRFYGFDGSNYNAIAAEIRSEVTGGVSTGVIPGNLKLLTSQTDGTLTTAVEIANDQTVYIKKALTAQDANIRFESYNDTNAFGKQMGFRSSRGTTLLPTAVQDGDEMYRLKIMGYDGTNMNTAADIRTYIDGTVATGQVPGKMTFGVNDGSGINPVLTLNKDLGMTLNARSSAPSSPVTNSIYLADGTTWDPASKSGAVAYPVFWDGVSYNALY